MMNARRSRFTRICRRLTRRTPDRRAQWNQISQLRPHGSAGHPIGKTTTFASIPCEPATEQPAFLAPASDDSLFADPPLEEKRVVSHPPVRGRVLAGTLAVVLFLLGCAFAALSGFAHTSNDTIAGVGIIASIFAMSAALAGVLMATSRDRKAQHATGFLIASTILFSFFYFVLLLWLIRV
jgi:hypothetical protein